MRRCLNACGKVCLIIECVENQSKISHYEDLCLAKSVKSLDTRIQTKCSSSDEPVAYKEHVNKILNTLS